MQNNSVNFQVRSMSKNDFPQLAELLKQPTYAVQLCVPYSLFEVDPDGWKVAVSSTGELLGVCCAVQFTDDFHYVGYYLVKEGYRGMGIGSEIWKACMGYIGPRNACMNCFPARIEAYTNKGGFSSVDPIYLITYASRDEVPVKDLSPEVPEGIIVVPFEDDHISAILEYDAGLGENSPRRQRLIELNCKEESNRTFVAFKNGACVGFGTMKITLLNVRRVMPLYADAAEIAETILKKLLQSFPDHKGLIMSTFTANKAAIAIMEKIKCPKFYESCHIYKNEVKLNFKSSMHKMFGQFDMGFSEF